MALIPQTIDGPNAITHRDSVDPEEWVKLHQRLSCEAAGITFGPYVNPSWQVRLSPPVYHPAAYGYQYGYPGYYPPHTPIYPSDCPPHHRSSPVAPVSEKPAPSRVHPAASDNRPQPIMRSKLVDIEARNPEKDSVSSELERAVEYLKVEIVSCSAELMKKRVRKMRFSSSTNYICQARATRMIDLVLHKLQTRLVLDVDWKSRVCVLPIAGLPDDERLRLSVTVFDLYPTHQADGLLIRTGCLELAAVVHFVRYSDQINLPFSIINTIAFFRPGDDAQEEGLASGEAQVRLTFTNELDPNDRLVDEVPLDACRLKSLYHEGLEEAEDHDHASDSSGDVLQVTRKSDLPSDHLFTKDSSLKDPEREASGSAWAAAVTSSSPSASVTTEVSSQIPNSRFFPSPELPWMQSRPHGEPEVQSAVKDQPSIEGESSPKAEILAGPMVSPGGQGAPIAETEVETPKESRMDVDVSLTRLSLKRSDFAIPQILIAEARLGSNIYESEPTESDSHFQTTFGFSIGLQLVNDAWELKREDTILHQEAVAVGRSKFRKTLERLLTYEDPYVKAIVFEVSLKQNQEVVCYMGGFMQLREATSANDDKVGSESLRGIWPIAKPSHKGHCHPHVDVLARGGESCTSQEWYHVSGSVTSFQPRNRCSERLLIRVEVGCTGCQESHVRSPTIREGQTFEDFGRDVVDFRFKKPFDFDFAQVSNPELKLQVWCRNPETGEDILVGTAIVFPPMNNFAFHTLPVLGHNAEPVGLLTVCVESTIL